jgi:hypothetical protein
METFRPIAWSAIVGFALVSSFAADPQPLTDRPSADFFESHVRPVLAEHCYGCHSKQSEKVKGGLLLDSREGLLSGGDSGPALVPGDPDRSLLIKAVRYADENLRMPPKNKRLPPQEVALLEAWVKMGAPIPQTTAGPIPTLKQPSRQHWAFEPVEHPAVPVVSQSDWVQDPVDQFVLAKLEAKGLRPSPRADQRALLRRVTFDLTGLPPTAQEISDFLADESSDAFAKVVERLLASPAYGERWGRYWLDVARYADTKGYVFEEERRYPYAYTYRDYVIRAFNEDLPFDRFIIQQIAADLLPLGDDKRPLAALGYLTLGRRFLNNRHDIIDDRIDVVTRGLMGLTVACARCHDHKYDPISTKDYYALYGVFASCSEPEEKPVLGVQPPAGLYADYLEEHTRRVQELTQFRHSKEAEIQSQTRRLSGEYMLAAHDAGNLPDRGKAEGLARERKLDPRTAERWAESLKAWSKHPEHPVFAPWFVLSECPEDELPDRSGEILDHLFAKGGQHHFNPLVEDAFTNDPPVSMTEVAARYGQLFAATEELWQNALRRQTNLASVLTETGHAGTTAPALSGLPQPGFEELRQVLYAPDSPASISESEITRLFDVPSIQKLRALQRKVEELDATHPGAPARAMALQDDPVPHAAHVLLRGNPNNPGPEVPRQFIGILSQDHPKPFQKGSGRLELAQAIASPDNPLTARVLVNRVWLHLFGAGLVRTPSDFGMRSEPPSHPELLDFLATRFMDEGWSLKKLLRWIVLSSTYQQSSDDNPLGLERDPANQLLWKMNRRRLDFEALRDSLLAVSGTLDQALGGRSVDITTEPFPTRRTLYGFVERQNLPGLFRAFDFASPDTTSPQRFSTTVPQQALFMINSPFVVGQTESLVLRPAVRTAPTCEKRIEALYEMTLQREPTAREIELAVSFIQAQPKLKSLDPDPVAWQYGYGEYDRTAGRLKRFEPLPYFADAAWQGGPSLPDAKLGWAQIKASGGHPGDNHQHAVVRRWTAPRNLSIAISGTLRHDSEKGDGVEAWVVLSDAGELGSWMVQHGKQETSFTHVNMRQGATLDFIVDCRNSVEFDTFNWAPVIKAINSENDALAGLTVEWDARQDFSGPKSPLPPLDAWGRLAQVLLMSNEFAFLD